MAVTALGKPWDGDIGSGSDAGKSYVQTVDSLDIQSDTPRIIMPVFRRSCAVNAIQCS